MHRLPSWSTEECFCSSPMMLSTFPFSEQLQISIQTWKPGNNEKEATFFIK